MRSLIPALLLLLLSAACSGGATATSGRPPTATPASSSTSTTGRSPARPPFCDEMWQAEKIGTVASEGLDEISGAAVSRTHPGVMWVHNDSGDDAAVYATALDGTALARITFPDLIARDWEDMAIGPGPDPDRHYLYLADIGDNRADRDGVLIHRVPEPDPVAGAVSGVETLLITYATGSTEAETLLVDPITGDIVIASKALSGITRLFALPGTLDWSAPQEAAFLGDIALGSFAAATGGDAGLDRVVVRTYDEVFLWERAGGLAETLLSPGCRVASVREQQGEAIALSPSGDAFYTVSEGRNQPVFRFAN